ncbi:MAG: MBL fold metallo-hydrolase [Candidatus Omnitrophica bacterium]|nr:MBL fold metallo-hydrolase [Candidatus Omnitrophota bacterium]
MAITLTFLGAARTVTGSMHLLSTDKTNILFDCGLFQGKRDEYYDINSHFAFDPQNLDACIISHAHIDHCGNIPTLIKNGFRGDIYTTPVTRDLCRYMLTDSGFIQEEDIKYVNKINKKRGLPPRNPLYTSEEAMRSLKYFRTLEYHTSHDISKDVSLIFYEAGHILGSSISIVEVKTGKKNIKIAYACDLGRRDMPLLKNPEVPKDIDYLIIESTYGGRLHEPMEIAEKKLINAINKTIKRGGKIIIPSFALERTQLVVFFISELIKRKKIPKIPIYVDGPLAVNLTEVFRENWQYFDDITRQSFLNSEDPLGYDNITYIKAVNDSKKLHNISNPSIIISASGMCENGRVLHHLKNNVENPNNTILIVGYMAEDTLGRKIVERNPEIRIFGRPYDLRAEVIKINAFSAHADNDGLVEYANECKGKLKEIFIVHGELEKAELLKVSLKKKINKIKATIPKKEETFFLKAVEK